jgi:hypothetical protein
MSSPYDQNPRPPGPARTFIRNNWLTLTGITVFIGTVGFPLVAVVRNNEAEYQATGDVGALFGHPFERVAHTVGLSSVNVTTMQASTAQYRDLITKFPNLRLDPKDSPDIRALKISAINAQWKTFAELEIGAANDNEAQIRKQLFAVTKDPRTLRDDPRTPGIGYRPTEDDIKRLYPGKFDEVLPEDWDNMLPRPDQPALVQLAAVEALSSYIKTSVTAEEQARADTQITQPAIADARIAAMSKDYSTHLHMVRMVAVPSPLPFYGVEMTAAPPEKIDLPRRLDEPNAFNLNPDHVSIVNALAGSPSTIRNPRTLAPLFTENGSVLIFHDFVGVWDGDEWGFVPLSQYRAAHLPEKETDL